MKNRKKIATSLNAKFNNKKAFIKGDIHFRDKLVNAMMQKKLIELGFEYIENDSKFRTNAPIDTVETLMKFAMKSAHLVCFGEQLTDQETELMVNDIISGATDDEGRQII